MLANSTISLVGGPAPRMWRRRMLDQRPGRTSLSRYRGKRHCGLSARLLRWRFLRAGVPGNRHEGGMTNRVTHWA